MTKNTDTRSTNDRSYTRARCPKCRFRIRGKNHENGQHCTEGRGGKYQPKKF